MKDLAGVNYLQSGLGDDAYESNDTRAQATAIPGDGRRMDLVLRVGHDDWFRVPAGAFDSIWATVIGNPDYGEIGVEVYRDSELAPVLTAPAFQGGRTQFSYQVGSAAQDILLHVFLKTGQRNTYQLYLNLNKPQPPGSGTAVILPTQCTQVAIKLSLFSGLTGLDTTGWIEWGTSPDLGSFEKTPVVKVSGDPYYATFTQWIIGLSPNTVYYYRSVASNEYQTVRGGILSFKTAATTMNVSQRFVDLGDIPLNVRSGGSITITNTGALPLIVSAEFYYFLAEFDYSTCLPFVPPGGTCTVSYSFILKFTGTFGRTLQLRSNSESGDVVVDIIATAKGPVMGPVGVWDTVFNQLIFSTGSWREWQFRNYGNGDLLLTNIEVPQDFEAKHDCVGPIPPNGLCAVMIRFTPKRIMSTTAPVKISYNNNDPDGYYVVWLQGSSTDLQLSLTRPKRPSRNGSNAQTFELTLTPSANMRGEATLECEGMLPGMSCRIVPSMVPVDKGSVSATVTVAATTRSRRLTLGKAIWAPLSVKVSFQGVTRKINLPVQVP
jgi:hypothetical protein